MKRRELIALLGGSAAAWPLAVRAQQPAIPVIGFLRSASFDNTTSLMTAFRAGLKESGFVEGQNVAFEFRSAEGHSDRLPALAAELVHLPAAMLICNTTAASAAKTVTTTVPIVFATASDPIQDGFVTSMSRPGGNLTGVSFLGSALGSKQLKLLRELVPMAKTIAVLVDTNFGLNEPDRREIEATARTVGQQLIVLNIGIDRDLDTASVTLTQQRPDALLVTTGAFFLSRRDQIIALAARQAVPAIYWLPEFVAAGGLMSYGASITDAYRQVGIYAGKILNGAKPGDLPVQQSTKVELAINLKTANALGLTIPQSLLARADEVIE
jgi:putative tryptophan/tyrosine transport system substrate-binding protein